MSDKLARLLFPDVKSTPEELEKRYPPRNLPSEACVTRFAPSPTGFLHLGNLWSSLIDERLAHQSGGVFYLRLEDTDQKREIKGAIQGIFNFLNGFDLNLDEGFTPNGEIGAYGPYVQSERKPIYEVFAKQLVFEGKAYPCFCAPEQLEEIKKTQNASKENTGYYGKWAKCRDLTFEEIESKINNGEPYIIRFRSPGDEKKRITVNDLVKGSLELPENIRDELVLKSDGLPTYHFAHVVDDHLMHTTHVVRGDEYLSTLPVHAQFFEAFGWEMPQYIHHAMLQKQEGESKRKLSKRKDPELSLDYYGEVGYMPECLKEYIMTLLNSNYEEWRMADPRAKLEQFGFKIEKLSPSGALFDLNKLNDISKNYISALSADEIYAQVTNWAKKHDIDLYHILNIQEKYAKDILSIGRGGDKPRKDVTFMSEVKNYLSYFYDDLFVPDYKMPESFAQKPEIDSHVIKNIAEDYIEIYEPSDDAAVWFDKIKQLAAKHGFARETKLYKKNPQEYKGSVGDVSMILRVAVCGRQNSPDMHEVFSIMGKDMIRHRLAHFQNESIRPKFPKRAVITGGMPYGEKEIYFHHVGGYFIHADIFARFMRNRIGPENVLFVSGIDCYGAGVEIGYEKAAAGGFSGTLPEFVAQNHKIQKETLDKYQISLDIYAGSALGEAGKIHAALSEEIFEKLYTGGFLKLERATQFFDAEKGLYLNGRQVKGRCPIQGCKSENAYADECSLGHQYKPEELIEPVSVLSGKVPDRVFSDNWFFDLPAYEKRLKSAVDEWKNDPACRKTLITVINEFFKKPSVYVKKESVDEIKKIKEMPSYEIIEDGQKTSWALEFENLDARQAAVSVLAENGIRYRTGKTLVPFRLSGNVAWGIPVPEKDGAANLTFWVWPESLWAPISFTKTILGDGTEGSNWEKWWKSDEAKVYQFIGEDNIYFYGIAEMGIFMALNEGYRLPLVVPNRHILLGKTKASSSSEIKPPTASKLLDYYTPEQLRLHFMNASLSERSVGFEPKALLENSEGFDTVLNEGNLVTNIFNRIARSCFYTAQKYNGGELPGYAVSEKVKKAADSTIFEYENLMASLSFDKIFELLNIYLREASKDWAARSKSENAEEIGQLLSDSFHVVRTAASLFHPITPSGCEMIREYLGVDDLIWDWKYIFEPLAFFTKAGHKLKFLEPRVDFFKKHPSQL